MEITEDVDYHWQEEGTLRRRYRFKTEGGLEFLITASIEEVPMALREHLQWVITWLNIRLQDLALIIGKETK